jgi:hypothetical protein
VPTDLLGSEGLEKGKKKILLLKLALTLLRRSQTGVHKPTTAMLVMMQLRVSAHSTCVLQVAPRLPHHVEDDHGRHAVEHALRNSLVDGADALRKVGVDEREALLANRDLRRRVLETRLSVAEDAPARVAEAPRCREEAAADEHEARDVSRLILGRRRRTTDPCRDLLVDGDNLLARSFLRGVGDASLCSSASRLAFSSAISLNGSMFVMLLILILLILIGALQSECELRASSRRDHHGEKFRNVDAKMNFPLQNAA